METMAMELEDRCPICLDSWEEASYVMPCLHQFCYPCIMRWAESNSQCPLCRGRVISILHSVRADDDFVEEVITPPAVPSAVEGLTEEAPAQLPAQNPQRPAAASLPSAARPVSRPPVGGLYPVLWAFLFRADPALLQPVLSWLQQQLGLIFEDAQEAAAAAQQRVLSSLLLFGLDEETLAQLLQDTLGGHTRSFVHRLIATIVERCSREAQHRAGMGDAPVARGRESSPTALPSPAASRGGSPAPGPAPSSSPDSAEAEELPTTSVAAPHGGPSSPSSLPVPTHDHQEEREENPEEAVPGPSAPRQGTEGSRGGARRPPKRRASSHPEVTSPPSKRPSRRRQ